MCRSLWLPQGIMQECVVSAGQTQVGHVVGRSEECLGLPIVNPWLDHLLTSLTAEHKPKEVGVGVLVPRRGLRR